MPSDLPGVPAGPGADQGAGSAGSAAWPAWRLWEPLAGICILAFSQLVLGLGLGIALRRYVAGGAGVRIELALPVVVVGSHAATWAAIGWIIRRHGLRFRRALALDAAPTARLLRPYLAGIALYFVLLPLLALFPPPPDETSLFTEIFHRGGPALAVLLVTAVLLAPALEEALFRGLLLPAARRGLRPWPAAVAVTLVFTALHVTQVGDYWPALAGIFACGLALARLKETTGSLWPSIAFHMGFNSTPFLVWLAVQPFGGLKDGPLAQLM
ncbi:MAG: CPBP family intramembrane glutamic endopeptidase [SAR324 cluster bacterium]